jgi:hypothetical protein
MPSTGSKVRAKHQPSTRRTTSPETTKPARLLPVAKRHLFKPATWVRNTPPPERRPLPKARALAVQSWRHLLANPKLFAGIAAVYGVLNIVLVWGFSAGAELVEYKTLISGFFDGGSGLVLSTLSSFVYLVTTTGGGTSPTAGLYQSLVLILTTLGLVWALRQTFAGNRPRVRDAFYSGMYPLVPFLLVLIVLGLQLLPMSFGATIYSIVVSNGVAVTIAEKLVFVVLFLGLSLWSLYMVTASMFALYMVTLPEMTPLVALRSANQLVYKRRMLIWRKLILLPVVVLVAAALVELPLILLFTPAAVWVFFVFNMAVVTYAHSYVYGLYRELL